MKFIKNSNPFLFELFRRDHEEYNKVFLLKYLKFLECHRHYLIITNFRKDGMIMKLLALYVPEIKSMRNFKYHTRENGPDRDRPRVWICWGLGHFGVLGWNMTLDRCRNVKMPHFWPLTGRECQNGPILSIFIHVNYLFHSHFEPF